MKKKWDYWYNEYGVEEENRIKLNLAHAYYANR